MSVSRAFTQRSSALRTLARQVAPTRTHASPVGRRGYSSAQGAAAKSSDMPWIIGSVAITVPTVGYLMMRGGQGSSGHDQNEEKKAIEAEPQAHTGSDESAPPGEGKSENKTGPKGGSDPNSPAKRSMTGQNVPPPPGDNADLAENWDEKKEKKQEFDELVKKGETRVATSSSTAPSKRTSGEHPREDPQKGEGEAVQKGDSKNE
ncbi:hypothetical protein GGS20DRAFT_391937 [Poronia punctata]|nr:hypothetical protein GGS20DRAFT_391937 [Poronia punctata]